MHDAQKKKHYAAYQFVKYNTSQSANGNLT